MLVVSRTRFVALCLVNARTCAVDTRPGQESERRLEGSLRDTRRHLAETTNLRSALRDAMGRGGDGAQLVGKLHLELDHSRWAGNDAARSRGRTSVDDEFGTLPRACCACIRGRFA